MRERKCSSTCLDCPAIQPLQSLVTTAPTPALDVSHYCGGSPNNIAAFMWPIGIAACSAEEQRAADDDAARLYSFFSPHTCGRALLLLEHEATSQWFTPTTVTRTLRRRRIAIVAVPPRLRRQVFVYVAPFSSRTMCTAPDICSL